MQYNAKIINNTEIRIWYTFLDNSGDSEYNIVALGKEGIMIKSEKVKPFEQSSSADAELVETKNEEGTVNKIE